MFYTWDVLIHSFLHLCHQKYAASDGNLSHSIPEDVTPRWRRKLRIRVTASVQQTTSFRRNFMRASRAPPVDKWHPVILSLLEPGRMRRRIVPMSAFLTHSLSPALLPRTITVFPPFLLPSREQPSLCVPAVFARLIFQIPWNHRSPVPSLLHKNRNRNRMPETPTGVSSGPRNGPPCTPEHPSFVPFIFQAGWNRIKA